MFCMVQIHAGIVYILDSARHDSPILEIVCGVLAAVILIASVIVAVTITSCFLNRKGKLLSMIAKYCIS